MMRRSSRPVCAALLVLSLAAPGAALAQPDKAPALTAEAINGATFKAPEPDKAAKKAEKKSGKKARAAKKSDDKPDALIV
ncbi:MAG: hypothetical protein K0Q54_2668, partial [Methylobacterium brachiatum]|nr:hypothetical protein [Methylobacterium brachiatum]